MKTATENTGLVKKKRQKRVRQVLERKKGKKVTRIKLEPKPLTEEQIKFFIEHYNKKKSIPGSKIPCNLTGKLTTCVGPWLVKKVKEYGGIENLLRKYKSRSALKAKRDATKPAKKPRNKKRESLIKKVANTDEKVWDLPKVQFEGSRPLTPSELTECTKTECLRPDIYLNNDYACNGCKYYDLCVNKLKRLAKNTPKKKTKSI